MALGRASIEKEFEEFPDDNIISYNINLLTGLGKYLLGLVVL